METKIYVGNLAFSTTEDELRTLFAQAGTVTSVEVIKDKFTGKSKGFAFVQMSTQEEMEKAISMFAGQTLGERTIKVSQARPREDKPYGGGFGHRTDRQTRGGERRGGGQRRY